MVGWTNAAQQAMIPIDISFSQNFKKTRENMLMTLNNEA